ncbi:MAG: tRNA (guanosine(46)-N7)-methyltransferase TrmB [Flavobacteriales bacterium]|nr:tRNA (guanosine(46)-N7)-methyltransferase TrmB [Flavobacteriales bacterium]
MGKDKLRRYRENESLPNVIQPGRPVPEEVFKWKGKWAKEYFGNMGKLILELGCGKGDYTLGLARRNQKDNFIGVDIKGARIWRGARTALDDGLQHVAFIRSPIEWLPHFFAQEEVDDIWITFPDPQLKRKRTKKRLTSPGFLDHYRRFLSGEGLVRLKTDSAELFEFTNEVLDQEGITAEIKSDDVYAQADLLPPEVSAITTFYESRFLAEGKPIHYVAFNPHKRS